MLADRDLPRAPGPAGGPGLEDGGVSPALAKERIKAFLARNAADAEKYVDRYCEASKGLKPLRSPGASERKRDAALYLGVRVGWEDGRVGLLHLPKSLTDVQSLRHASFGGAYLLYPGVPRAVKEKALRCMPARCTAINEALSFTSSVREFVDDTAGELEWLQQQSPCDPALARTLARAPAYDEKRLQDLLTDSALSAGGGGIGESMRALLDGGL